VFPFEQSRHPAAAKTDNRPLACILPCEASAKKGSWVRRQHAAFLRPHKTQAAARI
jgi:hypothetical protein